MDRPEEGANSKKDGGFYYSYSAPTEDERREIEGIRSQYTAKSAADAKLAYVKKLDKKVRGIPKAAALTLGIVGILIFGGGLTLCLEGTFYGALVLGVVISAVGVAVMACAKPLHTALSCRLKKKYGDTILKLTSELLGEEGEEIRTNYDGKTL